MLFTRSDFYDAGVVSSNCFFVPYLLSEICKFFEKDRVLTFDTYVIILRSLRNESEKIIKKSRNERIIEENREKEDSFIWRAIVVAIASLLMAMNINTFVHAGGLLPGGASVLEGEGSYEHCERNVVYSVVSGAESGRVIRAVKETDPAAFVNVLKTERIIGRFYQRPTD